MDLLSKFKSFLAHYGEEIGAVAHTLGSVVNALPLQADDKTRLEALIERLAGVPANIANSLDGMSGETVVHVAASDVEKAVGDYLANNSTVIAAAVNAYILAHPDLIPKTAAPAPEAQAGEDG